MHTQHLLKFYYTIQCSYFFYLLLQHFTLLFWIWKKNKKTNHAENIDKQLLSCHIFVRKSTVSYTFILIKSVALHLRRFKTYRRVSARLQCRGFVVRKTLSLNLNASFLSRFSLLLISSNYVLVLTRMGGPRPRPYTPRKIYRVEPGIVAGTSWMTVRRANHYTKVIFKFLYFVLPYNQLTSYCNVRIMVYNKFKPMICNVLLPVLLETFYTQACTPKVVMLNWIYT